MGKGDRRTKKGKIWRKSFGKTRPRKDKNQPGSPQTPAPETPKNKKEE